VKWRSPRARYFGHGHTGTVETIFRLAEARHPERWAESAIPPEERKVWRQMRDGLGDGSIRIDNATLEDRLLIETPKPHDPDLRKRLHDVMEICKALRLLLDSGRLQANYCDEHGSQYFVPARFWRGDDEIVIPALLHGAAWLDSESERDKVAYRLIRLPEAELELVWPELVAHDRQVGKAASDDLARTVDSTATPVARREASENSLATDVIHVKSEAKIHEAIMAVYAKADEQNVAIPNNRKMCKFVNAILGRKFGRANVTLIERLAGEVKVQQRRDGRYKRLFLGSGETTARKNLQRCDKLIV
jgi:hypothetical protein